jgi:DNA-binding response OmpR family regulator
VHWQLFDPAATVPGDRCGRLQMYILLVEDDRPLLETIMDALVFEGFDVCGVETGDEAAGLIEKPSEEFNLLITDIDLPGKRDGLGVASLMHRLHPALPVIYITGSPDAIEYLGLEETLLPKPFKLQMLLSMVQELLAEG